MRPMAEIFFSLREDIDPAELAQVLLHVRDMPGVSVASQVMASAVKPALRAKCFARVDSHASAEKTLERIRSLPEVLSAGLPAQRGLP